jgi:UDP-2,3-diacylglucosamine hydrolase
MSAPPVGLLAGSGRFPIVFAQKARQLGIPVVCVGIRHEASPELASLVSRFYWSGVARMGRMIRCFRHEDVRHVVMAGKIQKTRMHTPLRWLRLWPDWRTVRFWLFRRRRDNRDDTLLLGLIDEFAADGMTFASALDYCPELLVQAGILTRRPPSPEEALDIEFGWQLAKEMGRLDVGQGELCPRGGFTVVKVAKPQQDMRFDVPTVGRETVETLRKAGGRVLAIEAGKTIVIDQDVTVALADQYGLTIVARAA